jgi:hypothetical protein
LSLTLDEPGSRDWEWSDSVVVLVVVAFVVRSPRNELKKSSYLCLVEMSCERHSSAIRVPPGFGAEGGFNDAKKSS